jgi:hypothetical protein
VANEGVWGFWGRGFVIVIDNNPNTYHTLFLQYGKSGRYTQLFQRKEGGGFIAISIDSCFGLGLLSGGLPNSSPLTNQPAKARNGNRF